MKAILKNVSDFISEQKEYYEEHLKISTKEDWALDVWTAKNGGWLATARRNVKVLNFRSTARLKGFANIEISNDFCNFIKAMLVQEYRTKNSGQEALQASLLVLKRLFVVLKEGTQQTHPSYITTQILEELDDCSTKYLVNYADSGFKLAQLQKVITAYGMTFTSLNYVCKHSATNKHNTSKKQRETSARLKEKVINDKSRNGDDDTISIAAFLSLVWLSNNNSNQWENLGLKLMDILIPTGFRISELLILPRDCWNEREVISEKTGKTLLDEKGKPMLVHGLRYFGLKKSNARIHWLEPNSAPVVKRAIEEIKEITSPFHKHTEWLRETNCSSILPPQIKHDEVSMDEFLNYLYQSNSNSRGESGLRDKLHKWTQKKNIAVTNERIDGRRLNRWYSRDDVERVIRNLMFQPEHPLDFEFDDGNKTHTIKLDELLIVVPSSALNLANASRLLPAVQPLSGNDMLPFLGRSKDRVSIFSKYNLTEKDGSNISLRTHAPRHNINTFLALSGISEHQQAMAMGRVSIEQNAAYQHMTTVEKQKIERSSIEYDESKSIALKSSDLASPVQKHILTPIETVKDQGRMLVNRSLDLESNLQNSFHALDNKEMTEDLIETLLNDDLLLGEMQEAWNCPELKNTNDETKKHFIETHGFMHITVNGACTENIATSGCAHRLRCVSGSGCSHLHVTGRAGELENIEFTYKKKAENLAKFLAEYGDDVAYKDSITHMTDQVKNLKVLYDKAKNLQSNKIPIQVFSDGKNLGSSQPRRTLIDLYSEALPALSRGEN